MRTGIEQARLDLAKWEARVAEDEAALATVERQAADIRERRASAVKCANSPREIIRAALALNAAAVVLTHNHPSGNVEPSRADEVLTQNIKHAARFVDLQVLDHVIVSETAALSMADRGLV